MNKTTTATINEKCERDETFWVFKGHASPVTELVRSATVTKNWWIHAKVAAAEVTVDQPQHHKAYMRIVCVCVCVCTWTHTQH